MKDEESLRLEDPERQTNGVLALEPSAPKEDFLHP